MRTQYTPKLVFSVCRESNSHLENYNHHCNALKALEMAGVPTVKAIGVYRGIREFSIIIKDTPDNRENVLKLCNYYFQESYLEIDNEGTGTLVFLNQDFKINLGRYSVSNNEPSGDFTKVGEDYVTFG